jgi:uncharacterized membrane protein
MAILRALLVLAYPLLIYAALQRASPRAIALCALALLAARSLVMGRKKWLDYARIWAAPATGLAIVFVASAIWNDPLSLLAAPALGSLALLAAFGRSLREHESIVEAIARVQLGALTQAEARYCRRVTWIWCAFFFVNGAAALGLARWGAIEVWALYTGFVSYLLVGTLFSAEYVYRQWRFRRYLGAPTDVIFRRLFPPRIG